MAPYIEADGMESFSFYGDVYIDCVRGGDQPKLILEGAGDEELVAVQDYINAAGIATIHTDENGTVFQGTPSGTFKPVHEIMVDGGQVLAAEEI